MRRLLTVMPHMPVFESCYPLIRRLHARGAVDCVTLLGPRLRATEPRIEARFRADGVPFRATSLLGTELWSLRDLAGADAVLSHTDPVAYAKRNRPRDWYMRRHATPAIMAQHGLFQLGLTYTHDAKLWEFHAGLMLVWRTLDAAALAGVHATDHAPRMVTTGVLKHNVLPVRPLGAAFDALLARHPRRILICHNYGHEAFNYRGDTQLRALADWDRAFAARPDVMFILRGHRGRRHGTTKGSLGDLAKRHPNVLMSDRHDGPLRMAGIHDLLPHVQGVVTHPSTVVVDALQAGVPVGILDNNRALLATLPQVDSADALTGFADTPDAGGAGTALLASFGDIDANLDLAASAVERWMDALPQA